MNDDVVPLKIPTMRWVDGFVLYLVGGGTKSGVSKHRRGGRRGGLMFSALDSGSSSPGSSPDRGTTLRSWARHFTLTVPLLTQVYKWVPANLLLGGNPAVD